jgi:hypothetical protein
MDNGTNINDDGRCRFHTSIQLNLLTRNGKWLQILKECPLCLAYTNIALRSNSQKSSGFNEQKDVDDLPPSVSNKDMKSTSPSSCVIPMTHNRLSSPIIFPPMPLPTKEKTKSPITQTLSSPQLFLPSKSMVNRHNSEYFESTKLAVCRMNDEVCYVTRQKDCLPAALVNNLIREVSQSKRLMTRSKSEEVDRSDRTDNTPSTSSTSKSSISRSDNHSTGSSISESDDHSHKRSSSVPVSSCKVDHSDRTDSTQSTSCSTKSSCSRSDDHSHKRSNSVPISCLRRSPSNGSHTDSSALSLTTNSSTSQGSDCSSTIRKSFSSCDFLGRCIYHPNIQLKTRRTLEGLLIGKWKTVMTSCSECAFDEVQRLRQQLLLDVDQMDGSHHHGRSKNSSYNILNSLTCSEKDLMRRLLSSCEEIDVSDHTDSTQSTLSSRTTKSSYSESDDHCHKRSNSVPIACIRRATTNSTEGVRNRVVFAEGDDKEIDRSDRTDSTQSTSSTTKSSFSRTDEHSHKRSNSAPISCIRRRSTLSEGSKGSLNRVVFAEQDYIHVFVNIGE